jgi:uncharacterized repeat protein (TIGR03803 family)
MTRIRFVFPRFVFGSTLLLMALFTTYSAVGQQVTETTVYTFAVGQPVANPVDLIADGHGNFFGTGMAGNGTVYELSPNSQGGWTQTLLYEFPGATGPYTPTGIVMDAAGNIFGVSSGDDIPGVDGLAFELSPNGQGGYTYQTIHEFAGSPDGSNPYGIPILDAAGNLYGTTIGGGTCTAYKTGCGTVYELSPQSNGQWTETILHNFGAFGQDGQLPMAGVVFDSQGNLYGTTQTGGFVCTEFGESCGTVYELIPAKNGTWNEKILYKFNLSDGQYPEDTPVLDSAGNLYATTEEGGPELFGNVFKLTPTSKGEWTEQIVHNFTSFSTGSSPSASVTINSAGELFVETTFGGAEEPPCLEGNGAAYGCGTVWEFKPTTSGGWNSRLLYTFTGGSDGRELDGPSLVLDSQGNLYGTAFWGGNIYNDGTIFEITP